MLLDKAVPAGSARGRCTRCTIRYVTTTIPIGTISYKVTGFYLEALSPKASKTQQASSMFDQNHFQGLNATELPEFEEAVSKYKEPGQIVS